MVVVEVDDYKLYLDGYLKKNLDFVKDRVLKHRDMFVCVIDGRPGTGKSTLACQLAYYMTDGRLSIDDETFTIAQFKENLKKSSKGGATILDESFELNKRKTQSDANMEILNLLQQLRAKQCYIFLVLPFVFDLDKNVILGLTDLFIHCYRKDFGPRGQFSVYDRYSLKDLWLYARQSYSYPLKVARPNFRGKFTQRFPLNYDVYEEKKLKALDEVSKAPSAGKAYYKKRNELIWKLKKEGRHIDEICDLVGLKKRQVYDILEKMREVSEE